MKKIYFGRSGWNRLCILCLVPSLIGVVLFYLLPFLRVMLYSIVNNQFQKKLVWFKNYERLFENEFFRLALKNSLSLIFIGVPLLFFLSLIISIVFTLTLKKFSLLTNMFVFPMMVPTAAVVVVWQYFFGNFQTALPIYLLFVWKYSGICIVLLSSALTTVDRSVYEAAYMDGAGDFRVCKSICVPMIMPTIFFTILLAIMNSFKIFKESYLYYQGKYPPEHSYTLQFFMNNNFMKFDYPTLAAASIVTSMIILLIVFAGLYVQRRVSS